VWKRTPHRRWQSVADLERGTGNHPPPPAPGNGIVAGAAALAAVSAGAWFYLHRPPKLAGKDTVVLADFVNTLAIPSLMARFARDWRSNWNNRRSLKIMDDDQMRSVLRLMSLSAERPRHQFKSRTKSACAKAPRPPSTARSRAWEKTTSSRSRQFVVRMAQPSHGSRSRPKIKSTC
jgi:hypothetical protein